MLLIDLWTDFLAYTRPMLTSNTLILFLQMGMGAVSPILMILRAVKRESKVETVILCMVPLVLIGTVAVVQPLFFGAFLGAGFLKTEALQAFMAQPAFFREALILCGVFTISAVLYLLTDRKNGRFVLGRAVFNVGLEGIFLLVVLILSYDHFYQKGSGFAMLGGTAVKWVVYGLYLLAYKTALYLISLIWHLLFARKTLVMDPDWPRDYEKWLRHYVAHGYEAIGWGLSSFGAFYMWVVVWRIFVEEGPSGLFLCLLLMGLLIVLLGLSSLLFTFFPTLCPNWRRIGVWGNLDDIGKQLYQEIMVDKPLAQTQMGLVTTHFLVKRAPYQQLFYLPLLEDVGPAKGKLFPGWQFRFADGGKCTLNPGVPEGSGLVRQLAKMIARERLH